MIIRLNPKARLIFETLLDSSSFSSSLSCCSILGCFSGFLNGAIAALNNLENKKARPPPASMPATIPTIRLLDTVPNASPNAKAASRDTITTMTLCIVVMGPFCVCFLFDIFNEPFNVIRVIFIY